MAIAAPSWRPRPRKGISSSSTLTHSVHTRQVSVVNWDEWKGRNGGWDIDNAVCPLYMDMDATPGKRQTHIICDSAVSHVSVTVEIKWLRKLSPWLSCIDSHGTSSRIVDKRLLPHQTDPRMHIKGELHSSRDQPVMSEWTLNANDLPRHAASMCAASAMPTHRQWQCICASLPSCSSYHHCMDPLDRPLLLPLAEG